MIPSTADEGIIIAAEWHDDEEDGHTMCLVVGEEKSDLSKREGFKHLNFY